VRTLLSEQALEVHERHGQAYPSFFERIVFPACVLGGALDVKAVAVNSNKLSKKWQSIIDSG